MSALSEYVIIIVGVVLAGGYFFRDTLFAEAKPPPTANGHSGKQVNTSGGDPRDFVAKMKGGVSTLSLSHHYLQRYSVRNRWRHVC